MQSKDVASYCRAWGAAVIEADRIGGRVTLPEMTIDQQRSFMEKKAAAFRRYVHGEDAEKLDAAIAEYFARIRAHNTGRLYDMETEVRKIDDRLQCSSDEATNDCLAHDALQDIRDTMNAGWQKYK